MTVSMLTRRQSPGFEQVDLGPSIHLPLHELQFGGLAFGLPVGPGVCDRGRDDTCLPNLCVTPSFLAKLTDTNLEILGLLRYRVWELYGWHPDGSPVPAKPDGYDGLVWAPPLGPVADVRAAFEATAKRRPKDRTSIFVAKLGAFASDRPSGAPNSSQERAVAACGRPVKNGEVDRDRALGCLLGLAVGDALGTTLEFTTRDRGPVVRGTSLAAVLSF